MPYAKETDYLYSWSFLWEWMHPIYLLEKMRNLQILKLIWLQILACDVDGPVASTLRASTIADPFYGYDPQTESETDF